MLPDIVDKAIKYRFSRLPEVCGHTFYRPALGADSVVVDLGAHGGAFCHALIALYGCTCHAVEALPENCRQIPDLPNLHVQNYAVSTHDGPMAFNIAERPTAWGSVQRLGRTDYKHSVEVEGIRFERLLEKIGIDSIDLLKMDIEGEEISLFETTADETLKTISQLTVEFHDFLNPETTPTVKRIIQRLENLGFAVIAMNHRFHGDVLFINRASVPVSNAEILYFKTYVKYRRGLERRLKRYTGRES